MTTDPPAEYPASGNAASVTALFVIGWVSESASFDVAKPFDARGSVNEVVWPMGTDLIA